MWAEMKHDNVISSYNAIFIDEIIAIEWKKNVKS